MKLHLPGIIVAALLCVACGVSKPIPVILDTDIGGDIDDTWALGFLLKCPELDPKLVIGEFGHPEYRAKLIAKFLQVTGRTDIPVGIGIEVPAASSRAYYPQAEWVRDFDLKAYPGKVQRDGIQAMIDLIMESPEPITVICIGPLSNIAASLTREPRIAKRAKFVGMQGSIRIDGYGVIRPCMEGNVKRDPKSCQVVFNSPWDITITPTDTCFFSYLTGDRYERIRDSKDPVAAAIIQNYRIWNKGQRYTEIGSTPLFDTVAVYLAFRNDFCRMERLPIRVTDDGFTKVDGSCKMMNVATEWRNLDGFRDLLVERLSPP
jgi:inosine-uridine nucleoside N-ribohydrolase